MRRARTGPIRWFQDGYNFMLIDCDGNGFFAFAQNGKLEY